MILKEPGNIMIHWIQVLHLYEADFSALLSIKWRDLTYRMLLSNKLDAGIYGVVPGRVCHDPVLLSELQYEISRLTRKPYLEGKVDASGCFDMILLALTSATNQMGYAMNYMYSICFYTPADEILFESYV